MDLHIKLCKTCGKELSQGYEYLETPAFKIYKVLKCEECMIKETMNKAKADYETFKTIYDTIRSMPEPHLAIRCSGCGRVMQKKKYSKCSSCMNYVNSQVITRPSPRDTKI